jgi:hypothetical protein
MNSWIWRASLPFSCFPHSIRFSSDWASILLLVKRSGLRFVSLRLRPGALVVDADDLLADQAMTYAESRSRFARRRWPVLRKSRHGVRLNEQSRSGWDRAIDLGVLRTGSSLRIRRLQGGDAGSGRELGEITLGRSLVASFFANRLLGELSRLRSSASRASLVHVRAMSSRMSRTRGLEARSANH